MDDFVSHTWLVTLSIKSAVSCAKVLCLHDLCDGIDQPTFDPVIDIACNLQRRADIHVPGIIANKARYIKRNWFFGKSPSLRFLLGKT
jgi:hypothetical protein